MSLKEWIGQIILVIGGIIFFGCFRYVVLIENSFTIEELLKNPKLHESYIQMLLISALAFTAFVFGIVLSITGAISRLKTEPSKLKNEFKLYYNCPHCNNPLQYGVPKCPYCGCELRW